MIKFDSRNSYKYTKAQASQEMLSKRALMTINPTAIQTLDNEDITDDIQHYIKNDIVGNTLSYAGIFPYLFDFISSTCTHKSEYIDRKDNEKETHYRINQMPFDVFLDAVLGNEGKHYKNDFIAELKKIIKEKPSSYVYDNETKILTYTQIVIISIATQIEETPRQFIGLKNSKTTSKNITTISIDFYKPLWKDLFSGQRGVSWFSLPNFFHVKMKNTISQIQLELENMDFEERVYSNLYEIENTPTAFRKLFFYLNKHDNGQSERLNIDAIDMAIHCKPSLLRERNNKLQQKYWNNTRMFVVHGLSLLHRMGINKSMKGSRLVPEGVSYDKGTDKISIRINRDPKKPLSINFEVDTL